MGDEVWPPQRPSVRAVTSRADPELAVQERPPEHHPGGHSWAKFSLKSELFVRVLAELPAKQVPACPGCAAGGAGSPGCAAAALVPGERGRGLGRSHPGSCHPHNPLARLVQAQKAKMGLERSEIPFSSCTYTLPGKHRKNIYLPHLSMQNH